MYISKQPLISIPQFSSRDKAYVKEIESLSPFYKYPVSIDQFEQVIKDRTKNSVNRALLIEVLKDQYADLKTSDKVEGHIQALAQDNTFTIITAHQPSLMTGPSYYIYKILSAVRLTEVLQETYSGYQFVPIFITGGEDHDFEEVNHFNLFGKDISWQTEQVGSVGKFKLDDGFDEMFESLKTILGTSESSTAFISQVEKIKDQSDCYSQFAVGLMNFLFKDLGLVVLDMSDRRFKQAFSEHIESEIFNQASLPLVEETQNQIAQVGFKSQAMARPINFFYTGTDNRLRIEKEGDIYKIVDAEVTFTAETLRKELAQKPEHFSPNVVMRPLFQEFTIPNLAYIGGGGEIAYWLERKSQFEAFGINFPMLIRRNSAIFIDKGSQKKMAKLGLEFESLLQSKDNIISQYLSSKDGDNLNFDEEIAQIESIFEAIATKAQHIDQTLRPKILAEGTKQVKQVEQLTSRVKRSAKQNEEVAVSQIEKLVDKLFPNNGLQERKSSFLEVYLKHGPEVFIELLDHFNPLEKTMVIIQE